jgi:hypothetical protein
MDMKKKMLNILSCQEYYAIILGLICELTHLQYLWQNVAIESTLFVQVELKQEFSACCAF